MRPPVAWLAVLLLFGPAETLAGKYPRPLGAHGPLPAQPVPPLPDPLPESVDALCRCIESGHAEPALFEALGESLLRDGRAALAFRAFDRASRADDADRARLERRKAACGVLVDREVIEAEERLARVWVAALDEYRRAQVAAGRDPADLEPFFERYGRPEQNMLAVQRAVRWSFVGGAVGVLVGVAFGAACRRVPRAAALLPFAVAAACYAAPSLLDRRGILPWGAGASAAGGIVVAAFGRRA